MITETEKEIIEKSKIDRKCFAPIYEKYVKDVYRYSYSLLYNVNEAEEVTSETYLKALTKLDTFELRSEIKFWLITIARNIIYDRFRKARELPLAEDAEEYIGQEDGEYKVDTKLQRDVQGLLIQLPEVTREIITLKIWEEYTFEEIATIVNKKVNAVKQQFYRGMDNLKELLEQKGYSKDYAVFPIIFGSISRLTDVKEILPSDAFTHSLLSELLNGSGVIKFNLIPKMKTLSKPLQILIGGTAVLATATSMGVIYNTSKNPVQKPVVVEKQDATPEPTAPLSTVSVAPVITSTDDTGSVYTYQNDFYHISLQYSDPYTVSQTYELVGCESVSDFIQNSDPCPVGQKVSVPVIKIVSNKTMSNGNPYTMELHAALSTGLGGSCGGYTVKQYTVNTNFQSLNLSTCLLEDKIVTNPAGSDNLNLDSSAHYSKLRVIISAGDETMLSEFINVLESIGHL